VAGITRRGWRGLAAPVMALALAGCTVFGVRGGTEQPDYRVVRELDGDVEVRRYGPRLAAETTVRATDDARDQAFRRLAGYIFGGNRDEREIAMTAPVATTASAAAPGAMPAPVAAGTGDGELIMRFFLPAAVARADVPAPSDPTVRLVDVPAETLAVRRFSGRPDDARVAAETERLLAALSEAGVTATGPPRAFFYDPPWTVPALRRNEVAVPIEPRAGDG